MAFASEPTVQHVPKTRDALLDPDWLSTVLTPLTGGESLRSVELIDVFRSTVATAIRIRVAWGDHIENLCIKAYLDMEMSASSSVGLIEPYFYRDIAPRLGARMPRCVATVINDNTREGIVIMQDLVAEDAIFCSALEPFSVDDAAASLEQFAHLHAGAHVLDHAPWIERRVSDLVAWNIVSPDRLQELLNGERGLALNTASRDVERLIRAMHALAERDASLPATVLHGDCHAGNMYRSPEGPGLLDWQMVQRGGWAIDIAYHISAVLPVDLAEAQEERLLAHYLGAARGLGCVVPPYDEALMQYRAATVYGFYMWAITTRPLPEVTNTFVDRLGKAVERHRSFSLLEV